jgi:hypothetical protein
MNPDDNFTHARDPQPGDLWTEMAFTIIALVIERQGEMVKIVREVMPPTKLGQSFDHSKIEWIPVTEFVRWLSYDTMPDTTWADVRPAHLVSYAAELAKLPAMVVDELDLDTSG